MYVYTYWNSFIREGFMVPLSLTQADEGYIQGHESAELHRTPQLPKVITHCTLKYPIIC